MAGAWARAQGEAPFLRDAGARQADTLRCLLDDGVEAGLTHAHAPIDAPVGRQLRVMRDRLALVLGVGDLAGLIPLERVTGTLSAFADKALDEAIAAAFAARYPDAPVAGFVALALGKHGGEELNYSSDIDPILLFDPRTMPHRAREEPGEAAVRIARAVVETLQARDADGYVFRVDLRLRPASEATPIALPIDAAIAHYESTALAWERAAFARARVAAGDREAGARFMEAIRPFVWRRSVDFGAVEALRALSRRIRSHHKAGQAFGPGFDLKRGRGGIREVEFFTQIHQLVHGGRDASLRARATLDALAALEAAGHLDQETVATLSTTYRRLRTIEHRVQMVDDRQTHALPGDQAALDSVARLHGLDDGAALLAWLEPGVRAVGTLYDSLDDRADAPVTVAVADPDLVRRLAEWRGGQVRALRSPAASEAFEALLPRLLAAFQAAPDPTAAVAAFDRLLVALPSAVNLFRLLEARPRLVALLVDILSYAPTLSAMLAQRPALFDRLIDATAFDAPPDVETLMTTMRQAGDAVEVALDRVRHVVGEERFALGAQLIEGAADPLTLARGYARLAEAAVATVTDVVAADFARTHGACGAQELVVLALGRLGGGALTHASDLDLVYLVAGDAAGESDGTRPLGSSLYFNRLATRVSGGLSAPTSVGALYEVDTRLRPSGSQGPLAVPVDAFARYQREQAWTWEHMALTRARVVAGSQRARADIAALIADILRRDRDTHTLRADISAMRADIARHKPPKGPLDVKHCTGGLIDLEFVTHYHQLTSGVGLTPDLGAAIAALAVAGCVDPAMVAAHDLMTRMIVTLRLVAPDMAEPGAAGAALIARACGCADWPTLMRDFGAARALVGAHWKAVAT